MQNERIRVWQDGVDDGSVHCLGNGLLCVYEQGPNIIQAFGPPYSTASTMRLSLENAPGLRCESVREPGTALWTHKVARQDGAVDSMQDFVDAELPCFVREAQVGAPLTLAFDVDKDVAVTPTKRVDGTIASLLLTVPNGRPLYNTYPMPYPVYYRLFVSGAASLVEPGEAGHWQIRLAAGTSRVYLGRRPLAARGGTERRGRPSARARRAAGTNARVLEGLYGAAARLRLADPGLRP